MHFLRTSSGKISTTTRISFLLDVKIMDDKTKKYIVDKFTKPDCSLRVIICSSAFGLGVDCLNVRAVINSKSLSTLTQFVQESSCGGRDDET